MYCTYEDVVAHTNTELDRAVIEALIAAADRRIDARLRVASLAPEPSDDLAAASLALTISAIVTRQRIDGSAPSSVSVGGASVNEDKGAMVRQLHDEAERIIETYIEARGTPPRVDLVPDPTRSDAGPTLEWL